LPEVKRIRRVPAVPSKPYHHGDLRRALLVAAAELIAREGPDRLSLRAVARAAGVSASAPYRHFEDKTALLASLAQEGFEALGAALGAAAGDLTDPVERLRAQARAYVRFAVAEPARFRLMFGRQLAQRAPHPSLNAAAWTAFSVLTGDITEAHAAGRIRGEPDAAVLAAWSMVHGLSNLLVDGQARDVGGRPERADALADALAEVLLRGLLIEP
jgi:AcrR family transcriptional regulator